MKIRRVIKQNDKYSDPFCPNIGAKYHVIPHHVHLSADILVCLFSFILMPILDASNSYQRQHLTRGLEYMAFRVSCKSLNLKNLNLTVKKPILTWLFTFN